MQSKKILVVDDEPINLSALANLLMAQGHQIFVANSGRKGILVAQKCCPDLLLSDIHMPEMNGYEMLELLKNESTLQTMRTVFISASESERTKALELSDGFLLKPLEPEPLFNLINDLVGDVDRP